jgi:hypothetical protein
MMLVIAELIRLSEIVIINTLDNSLVVKDLWLIVVTITSSKHPELRGRSIGIKKLSPFVVFMAASPLARVADHSESSIRRFTTEIGMD